MRFGYTILYVTDVEKTVAFYESAFGLKRTFVHESGYGELDTGETKLAFASVELATSNGVSFVPPNPEGQAPAVEVALVTDDVQAAFAQAVKAGAVPSPSQSRSRGVRRSGTSVTSTGSWWRSAPQCDR